MEEEGTILEKVREFIFKNPLFIGVIFFGLILCSFGVYQYFTSRSSDSDVKFITSSNEEKKAEPDITVDVEGEVNNPGVYKLKSESRIQDVVNKAGGFTSSADTDYISKNLNLAQIITDGAKIYIPAVGDSDLDKPVLGVSSSNDSSLSQDISVSNTGLININTATSDRLDTLPKVGPVTAQKIIENRPYGSIEELVSKKVIGQKTFDGLKDKISI